jgi:hypothetical protein
LAVNIASLDHFEEIPSHIAVEIDIIPLEIVGDTDRGVGCLPCADLIVFGIAPISILW